MARLTLPGINRETAKLVKMSVALSPVLAYLRPLMSNPRASDTELVRSLSIALDRVDNAKTDLDEAVKELASVAKTLERRKAVK